MAQRNVKIKNYKIIKIPSISQDEDRGLSRCAQPLNIVANIENTKRSQNDLTGIAEKCDVLTVELERRDGARFAAPGLPINFPYQPDAKGWLIDWRQLTRPASGGGVELDAGCYKVVVKWEISGLTGEYYYGAYNLLPWSIQNVRNTVQIYSVLDDLVRNDEINYKESGFVNTIRFKGWFGYMQPNYEVENKTFVDRSRHKNRIEALRSYELRTSYLVDCFTNLIDEQHLLAANTILITENSPSTHKQYIEFPVILSEGESPTFEYPQASIFAKMTALFMDKVAVWESKYNGDIEGSENVSFDLPQSVQASGCQDGTVNINQSDGTFIASQDVASGGEEDYNVADSPITVNTAPFANLKATDSLDVPVHDSAGGDVGTVNGGVVDIADSDVTANGDSFGSVLAEGSIDVPIEDENGNTLDTTVVGGVVQVFLTWYMIAVLAFRQRMIDEGATFETDETLTNNLLELGETEYNDALLVLTPEGYLTGVKYAVKPNDGTGDFSYVQNTANGTRINKNGEIEIVPANTPRINWIGGVPCLSNEDEATNINSNSLDVVAEGFSGNGTIWTATDFPNGGYGDLPYKRIDKIDTGVSLKVYIANSTEFGFRVFFRHDPTNTNDQRFLLRNNTTGVNIVDIRITVNYNIVSIVGNATLTPTNDNGWYEVTLSASTGINIGDSMWVYMFASNQIDAGDSIDICQFDVINDNVFTSPIITTGSIATRLADTLQLNPTTGITQITEYFEDGSTNVITTIPATYEPSKGQITKIIAE